MTHKKRMFYLLLHMVPAYAMEHQTPTPLLETIIGSNNVTLLQERLEQGLSPNAFLEDSPNQCLAMRFNLLGYASEKGSFEIVKLLLEKGADVNATGRKCYRETPIFFALEENHLEIAQFLLKRGANINKYNLLRSNVVYNTTSLKWALAQGADSSYFSELGITPLHDAMIKHICAVPVQNIQLFFDYNADANIPTRAAQISEYSVSGSTPLHLHTLCSATLSIAACLILNGANINKQSLRQYTPLHYACKNGRRKLVKYLLYEGADKTIKGNQGETPLQLALAQTHPDADSIIALLQSTKRPKIPKKARDYFIDVARKGKNVTTKLHMQELGLRKKS